MKKKYKKWQTLGNFQSPYSDGKNTMTEWYKSYKNDSEKILEINNLHFSKIIFRCDFYIYHDPTLMIAIEPQENLKIGDSLIDENGNEFKLKGIEMFRWVGGMPEWAFKISTISITGKSYTIGNYIAKK